MCNNPYRRLRARRSSSGVRCGWRRRRRNSPMARPPRQPEAMAQAVAHRPTAKRHPSSNGDRDQASLKPRQCPWRRHQGERHQHPHGAHARGAQNDVIDPAHFHAGNTAPPPPKRLGAAAVAAGKWRSIDAWQPVYRQAKQKLSPTTVMNWLAAAASHCPPPAGWHPRPRTPPSTSCPGRSRSGPGRPP